MSFEGTSAATPMVSAGVALLLQANPKLTWRDVQYIIAKSARITDPTSDKWQLNGAGYHVHHKMGFGTMDVLKMITMAETWKTVDTHHKCTLRFTPNAHVIPSNDVLLLSAQSDGCQGTDNQVLQLEHVQVFLSYLVRCRGDIKLRLKSPCGTWSNLMEARKRDTRTSLINWPFMSVFNWGEDPRGKWLLEVTDVKEHVKRCMRDDNESSAGILFNYKLVLWGVKAQHKRGKIGCVGKTNIIKNIKTKAKQIGNKSGKFVEGLSDKNMIKSALDYFFIEDFRQENLKVDASKIPNSNTIHALNHSQYTLPVQSYIMSFWRQEFQSVERKAKSLTDYILLKKYPQNISKNDFKVVRCTIAYDLIVHPLKAHEKEDLDNIETNQLQSMIADGLLYKDKQEFNEIFEIEEDDLSEMLAHILRDREFDATCAVKFLDNMRP